ncbi:34050_t:CDS:1, partial [Racocetra persica]
HNEANTERPDERSIKRCKNAYPLWAYFIASSNEQFIQCKLCKHPNGTYRKGSGISTIKRYFESNHKAEYQKYRSDSQEVEPYGVHDEEKVRKLNELLVRWIICNQQAFCVVEDKDFRIFIFELNPRYKLPTRQTVSTYVGLLYKREREQLRSYFRKFNHKVSITTDAWSLCTNQAFLSVTLHWIDDQWQMQHILLDFIPLHEKHTGYFLAETLFNLIEDFGLGKKILSMTADNASNMDVCGQYLTSMLSFHYENTTFHRLRCAMHILNLAVVNGLSEIDKSTKK